MSIRELHRALEAAIGYLELGMPTDALAEIRSLPEDSQNSPECLELTAVLHQHLRQWQDAASTYGRLCRLPSVPVDHFIAWACCLYEVGDINACRDALLQVPRERAEGHALWHFHLACYEAILGNRAEAGRLAEKCLRLDDRYRPMMQRNRNLAPLIDSIP